MIQLQESIAGLIRCQFECLVYPECSYPEPTLMGPCHSLDIVSAINWPLKTSEVEVCQKLMAWPNEWVMKLRPCLMDGVLHIRSELQIFEDIPLVRTRRYGFYGFMVVWTKMTEAERAQKEEEERKKRQEEEEDDQNNLLNPLNPLSPINIFGIGF